MGKISAEFSPKQIKIKQEDMYKWENSMIAVHGWYVHAIPVDDTMVNIHTHGIKETFGHDDFQIVVPLDNDTAQIIFTNFVDRIKNGDKFTNNQIVSNILHGYEVKLVNAIEEDRIVFRIILPDKCGKLDSISIESPFHLQYADLLQNVRVH